jgi:autotransporter-associated beta strand protein
LTAAVQVSVERLEDRTLFSTLYWDPSGAATANGGAGTWNTTTAEWRSGSMTGSLVTWSDSANNDAIFPASGGTVTLGAAITAKSLTFNANGYTVTGNALTLAGGTGQVTIPSGDSATISSVLAGTSGLTLASSGTLTLSGSNTYSGGTTLSSGRLNLNSTHAIGTGTFTINGGTIDNTSAISITLAANNPQIWGGDFTYAGSYTLNLGTGPVTLTSNRTITGSVKTLTVGGIISDSGNHYSLNKSGYGTLTLNGANTYSGTTTLTHGSLQIGNASALANSTVALSGSAALAYSAGIGGFTIGGLSGNCNEPLADTSSHPVTLSIGNNGSSNTYSGVLFGAGSVQLIGGTQTLSGVNTYTGGTTIVAGTLKLSGSGTLGDSGNPLVVAGGTLDLNGTNPTAGGLSGVSGSGGTILNNASGTTSTLTVGGGTSVFGGILADHTSGTGILALATSGTAALALIGTNTYSGATTIGAGSSLDLGNNGTAGSLGTSNVVDNGSLILHRTDAFTVANAISGSGTVIQSGSSTTSLTAANTYTGDTTINAGSLLVDGSVSSAVTVNSGGTLGGSGSVAGVVSVASGGILLPGDSTSSTGVLSTADVSLAAGANFDPTLNSSILGSGYSQLNVTGTVNLGGASFNPAGLRANHDGDQLVILNNDGTDSVTGTFSGLPEGGRVTVNSVPYYITYHGGSGNDVVLVDSAPPQAADDNYNAIENHTLTVSAADGVLANDTEYNGQTLSVYSVNGSTAAVGQPLTLTYGTLTLNADGSLTYVPDQDFVGVADATFYIATDGIEQSNPATVQFVVQDAALHATGIDVSATEGTDTGSIPVAHLIDDAGGQAGEYTTSVNWGDGDITGGTVLSDGAGGWNVMADHMYAADGNYMIQVSINDIGGSSASSQSTATVALAAPAAPSTLTATATSSSQINLTWADHSNNETGFQIERATNSAFTQDVTLVATTAANATSYPDTSLADGKQYYYEVIATDAAGDSSPSNIANAITWLPALSNLSATVLSSSQVRLDWTINSTNQSGFVVQRSTDGINFTTIPPTTAADAASYTDTGLSPGTTYYYQVQATNALTSSPFCDAISTVTIPAAPTATATADSAGQITVSWNDVPGEDGFTVERSPDGTTGWTPVGPPEAGALSYPDTGLDAGVTYYYRVSASNISGTSSPSAVASATTTGTVLDAPTDLSATVISANEIDLSWTASDSPDASGYVIYVSTDGATFAAFDEVTTDQTTYQATWLTPGVNYTFQVTTNGLDGESAASNQAGGTTPLAPPSDLSATVSQPDQIDLAWTDNSVGTAPTIVLVSTDGTTFTQLAEVDAGTGFYAAAGLTPDQAYTFKVTATYSGGESADPDAVTATAIGSTLSATGPDTINEGDSYTLTLSSTTPTDGISSPIDHWLIDWQDGSDIETITGESGSTLPHAFPASDSSEFLTITAVDGLGSLFSVASKKVNILPVAPTNLSASLASSGEVNLNWTAGASVIRTGFLIYESTDDTTFNAIDSVPGNQSSYQTTNLSANTSYTFRVTAHSDGGESAPSNSVTQATAYLAPLIDVSGDSGVVQGTSYDLVFSAIYPDGQPDVVSQWSIDWGDGQTTTYIPQADDGPNLMLSHTFANDLGLVNVIATATDAPGPFSFRQRVIK